MNFFNSARDWRCINKNTKWKNDSVLGRGPIYKKVLSIPKRGKKGLREGKERRKKVLKAQIHWEWIPLLESFPYKPTLGQLSPKISKSKCKENSGVNTHLRGKWEHFWERRRRREEKDTVSDVRGVSEVEGRVRRNSQGDAVPLAESSIHIQQNTASRRA